MTLLSRDWIASQTGLIEPFVPEKIRRIGGALCVSYGLSGHGYDIRLADGLRRYRTDAVIDPKQVLPTDTLPVPTRQGAHGRYVEIQPGGFLLGHSVERFEMPVDVIGVVLGKSTVARGAVLVLTTPLEAGWRGHITLELANVSPNWARVYIDEGIAQVLFLRAPCSAPYDGPYQDQAARVVLPFGGGT